MDQNVIDAYKIAARAILKANLPSEGPKSTDAATDWIKAVADGASTRSTDAVLRSFRVSVDEWQKHWDNKIVGRLQFNLMRIGVGLADVITEEAPENLAASIAFYAYEFTRARSLALESALP